MNYFNKNLRFGLLSMMILQAILSMHIEGQVLDEATLNELNERFEQEQMLTKARQREYEAAIYDFMHRYFGERKLQTILIDDIKRDEQLYAELMNAIRKGDLGQVIVAILDGVDVNKIEDTISEETPLTLAVEQASYSLEQNKPNSTDRLYIIELLIKAGALINKRGIFEDTPLESELSFDKPNLEIIKLLLGYGADITERVLEKAKKRPNAIELMKILDIHTRLLKQVKNNPTKELLNVSILYNKPYFVQLIVDIKPELVNLADVELAKKTSPASVPILKRALAIKKFEETELVQERFPLEIVEQIKKFAKHNPQELLRFKK